MTFIIENTHLGINENDIKDCEDLQKLKGWQEEILKQIIVMKGKLRKIDLQEFLTVEDKQSISKTTHAKELQGLLVKMIENKLEDLRADRRKSMEALYFTYAEQDLDVQTHQDLINKAERAMEGSI